VPAAKWSINKPASRRAQPAVVGRGLSEGLGFTGGLSALTACHEVAGAAFGRPRVATQT
jgi:hypothetical protein